MVNNKMTHRPTWAEVDLGAIAYNYRQVKKIVGNSASVLVIVKGNTYGHGMLEVAHALQKQGTDFFGVATLDEALYLREDKIKAPILILGSVLPKEVEPAIKNNVTLTLCDIELAKSIDRVAAKLKKKAKVHIKVDTGMGRPVGLLDVQDLLKAGLV